MFLAPDKKKGDPEDAPKKNCPGRLPDNTVCGSELPVQTKTCPLCGYEFKVELIDGETYDLEGELKMIELELIAKSPFKWYNLWGSDTILIAQGFDAWVCVCCANGKDWYSIGGLGRKMELLTISNRMGAIGTADDFMRANEKNRTAKKAAKWIDEFASPGQLQILQKFKHVEANLRKGLAGAYITFYFNQKKIEGILGVN